MWNRLAEESRLAVHQSMLRSSGGKVGEIALLLGSLDVAAQGQGSAVESVLAKLGTSPGALLAQLKASAPTGSEAAEPELGPEGKKVVERALQISQERGCAQIELFDMLAASVQVCEENRVALPAPLDSKTLMPHAPAPMVREEKQPWWRRFR